MAVNDYMLDFVARMQSGSGNFMLNAIDAQVLRIPEYREALVRELLRATKEGGIVIGSLALGDWLTPAFKVLDNKKSEYVMAPHAWGEEINNPSIFCFVKQKEEH